MKKILLLLLLLSSLVQAQDYMDYASAKANLSMPKISKFQRMLKSADVVHPNYNNYKYEPYTTNKRYTNCSKFLLVNCDDIRYSECWQCRQYQYVVEPCLPTSTSLGCSTSSK